jgi:CDP-diacylglycerol--glycerol-3-phosphate 3-phosphatidyltransferase
VSLANDRPIRTLPLAKTKTAVQITFLIVVMLILILERLPDQAVLHRFANLILDGPFIFLFLLVVVAMTVATGAMYFVSKPSEQASIT